MSTHRRKLRSNVQPRPRERPDGDEELGELQPNVPPSTDVDEIVNDVDEIERKPAARAPSERIDE